MKVLLISTLESSGLLDQVRCALLLVRTKTVDKLYCIGEFKRLAIKFNADILNEYKCLQGNIFFFFAIDKNFISDKTLTIFTMNMRSLVKHVQDLINDCRV